MMDATYTAVLRLYEQDITPAEIALKIRKCREKGGNK